MNKFLPILNTILAGIMFGAISFGLAFAVYMAIYIYRFGSYRLEIFTLSDTLKTPVLIVFVIGTVIGAFLGFCIGFIIGVTKPSSSFKGILQSVAVTGVFVLVFALISFSSTAKPSDEFYLHFLNLIFFLLLYLSPPIISGLIAIKVLQFSQSKN
jgi:hypothetical protein